MAGTIREYKGISGSSREWQGIEKEDLISNAKAQSSNEIQNSNDK
jgi:hypothetical protein